MDIVVLNEWKKGMPEASLGMGRDRMPLCKVRHVCKCTKCGHIAGVRETGFGMEDHRQIGDVNVRHNWSGVTCDRDGHNWIGCKCCRCGMERDEGHDWDVCICRRCGKLREDMHDWDGCLCKRCRRRRDEGHDWEELGNCRKRCKVCAGQSITTTKNWSLVASTAKNAVIMAVIMRTILA